MIYDVIIIGAGVIGCSIARELSKYDLKTLVVEAEDDIGSGTSKANSALVVTGFDVPAGTLESDLVRASNPMFDLLCDNLQVPFKRTGALVVAISDEEVDILKTLYRNAINNWVYDVELINREKAIELEPNLTKEIKAALYIPREGIISPFLFVQALAENARENGVEFITEAPVTEIVVKNGAVTGVDTCKGHFQGRYIVNATGLRSDEIARMVDIDNYKVLPRKGQFIILDKDVDYKINHILYPTPTPISRGILVSPTVDGNILLGPTAEDQQDKNDKSTTNEGLENVIKGAKKIIPRVDAADSITQYAGLRPVRIPDGYVLEVAKTVKGFINLSGIRSTGVSSSPAVAIYVKRLLEQAGLSFINKTDFILVRWRPKPFAEMTNEEREESIKKNPLYGNVVCRCEKVTEAEIIRAIHNPPGAHSIDAIKRRTRAGMGRCQGGYCSIQVAQIIARELNIPVEKVTKHGKGSEILIGPTRSDHN